LGNILGIWWEHIKNKEKMKNPTLPVVSYFLGLLGIALLPSLKILKTCVLCKKTTYFVHAWPISM
jgi:hypothetical protein